ncbi:protein phosphatase 1F [Thalassophryne amazonica]|uniref:protein phosphatase 1F n=1 Tax=Thalassophryne amazonica TaxID=390379 RepID=UPI001471A35A|nr:protein phosphatase 1F [Thalassophryne amazonica]XP_034025541.1 protein phosphatase 1F [Thalassophryne amazonica]
MEEEQARHFLQRFVEEFPAAVPEGGCLPVRGASSRLSLEELEGEVLDVGLKMLAGRGAPAATSVLLCQAALSQLLQSDLSPFYCPQEEEEEPAVLLQSELVQHLFLNKLIDIALLWHQNLPKMPATSSRFLQCCIHAIKNTRRKMEDKHVVLPEFNQLFNLQDGVDRAYYAVFDGHGGVDAAAYAATHLHVVVSKQESLQTDAATALSSAFRRTDDMFRWKAQRERLRSGTTGVVVLIQGQELIVSWLGDSQAVLVRKGHTVPLMDPHKPDREDEKQRIEDLGGCITFMGCWRVNGMYAVSRAIGDFDQKPYVSGDADCSTTQLCGDEDYVLLACDGFFDAVNPSEVPHLVLEALQQPGGSEGGADGPLELSAAHHLVAHAKAAGSTDNITVMLVFLRPPEELLAADVSAAQQ